MTATLEQRIGIDASIISFLRGTSVLDTLHLTEASDSIINKDIVIQWARDHNFSKIHELARDRKSPEAIDSILESYRILDDEGFEFSSEEISDLGNYILDNNVDICLRETSRRFFEEMTEKCKGQDELLSGTALHLMDDHYFMRHGTSVVVGMADAVENDSDLEKVYNRLLDHRGKSCNLNNILSVGPFLFEHFLDKFDSTKVRDKLAKKTALLYKDIRQRYNDIDVRRMMQYMNKIGRFDVYEDIVRKAVDDRHVKSPFPLYEVMWSVKPESAIKGLEELLKIGIKENKSGFVSDTLKLFDKRRHDYDKRELVEIADRLFMEDIDEDHPRQVVNALYMGVGWTREEMISHFGSMYDEAGKTERAMSCYQECGLLDKVFEKALDCVDEGNLKTAYAVLQKIDLRKVDTNNERFYKFITSSILSLYIPHDLHPNESALKKAYCRIKPFMLEAVNVSREDDLDIEIVLDGNIFRFREDNVAGEYRNDVRIFSQEGLGKSKSALKVYEDPFSAKKEAYWIGLLEGKVPVERVISTEHFGKTTLNQIELCNGVPLKDASYDTLKKAIDLSFDIYNEVNKQHSSDYMASLIHEDYVSERVSSFGFDAEDITAKLRDGDVGAIHNDYAPRNIMVEDSELVIIDHECYVHGNPVAMAVSLLYNPDNQITDSQRDELIGYARSKFDVSDEYLDSAKTLWLCRQARRCAVDSDEYKWYVGRMER